MNIDHLLNKHRINATTYTPGGAKTPIFKEGITICKLDANENQLKPSQIVIEAMKNDLINSYLYPFEQIDIFREVLSNHYNIDQNQFVVGNGTTSLICAIADLFFNPGDEILYSSPTYIAYRLLESRYGIEQVTKHNKNHASDVYEILDSINPKTKIVVLVNPNNPTGSVISKEDLEHYINNVPKHVVTIVDEAYIDFVEESKTMSLIPYIKENNNLIVLRTFSKLYALAGIRLGYAITSKAIQKHLVKLEFNYAPSHIAVIAGMSAIKDEDFIIASIKNNTEGRSFISNALKELNFDVIESQANFVYFTPNIDSNDLFSYLFENGIIIRKFPNNGLRVSVGIPYQNKKFINCIKDYLKQLKL